MTTGTDEIDPEELREREARRERRRREQEEAAKGKPAAKAKGEKWPRRLRSLKYPVVEARWLRLSDDFSSPEVLRAMCEVAGVPEDVIDDRLTTIEKAWANKKRRESGK